ncbi:TonB-dependent siderophore receptor [Acidovorax sp. SUPP3434]|uniref:TonB-dependent siderophore receptor n=1 Tax=Acidovorax sp. SUPP3434 TaxID=2920880 RepID=UPI0023DE3A82|nr:TonB-dependent receptor [Acidovorax sp. SUPP3434]GKT01905.1 TonB-dependent siderophore receptor [Acidovorax sp. SUPP3434]
MAFLSRAAVWRHLPRPPGALLPIALALSLGHALPAQAQAQAAPPAAGAAVQAWDLAPGALDDTLTLIARQGGRSISADPALLAGKRAPAIRGRFTAEQAAQQALTGSALVLGRTAGGALTVLPGSAPAASAIPARGAAAGATLAEVRVVADAETDGPSEGTGSYVPRGPSSAATGLALSVRETPQSVSVITRQRMDDEHLTTINDVLARTPGIATAALGTERSNANARGYPITNYQLDGISTHTEFLGLDALPAQGIADMALYDRIEVLRGASGLTTGAGDPSGIVNMVRKKPTAEFQGLAELGGGSWGQRRGVIDLSSPLNAEGSVRARMVAVHQEGDSYIDFYSRKKDVLYGVVEADLTRTLKLTAGIDHQESASRGSTAYLGFPLINAAGQQNDFPVSFSSASRSNRFDTNSDNAFASLEQVFGNGWKLKLSVDKLRSRQREDATYLAVSSSLFDPVTGDGLRLASERRDYRLDNETVDLKLSGPFELFGRQHEALVGIDHTDFRSLTTGSFDTTGLRDLPVNIHRWNNSGSPVFGPDFVTFDSTRRQKSLYAAGRFELAPQWKLIVGGKLMNFGSDYITDTTEGYHTTSPVSERRVFTPYGGIVFDLSPAHTLYASFATIYAPQNAQDRNGTQLDPTQGDTYEAGVKSAWLGGRVTTSASAYWIRQDNVAEADSGYFVPGTTNTASRAMKGVKTQGMDLEVNGTLAPGWNLSASYNFSQSRNAAGTRVNTTFPRQMARVWTTWRAPGDWSRLTLGGGVDWNSGIHYDIDAWQIDRTVTARQKAYAVASLMARYEVNDRLSVALNVQNVFDRKYIAAMSGWWYSGMYGAPRSAQVTARYRF